MRQVTTPSPQSMRVPSSEELVQRLLVPLQLWQWRPEPVIPCSARAIICLPWDYRARCLSANTEGPHLLNGVTPGGVAGADIAVSCLGLELLTNCPLHLHLPHSTADPPHHLQAQGEGLGSVLPLLVTSVVLTWLLVLSVSLPIEQVVTLGVQYSRVPVSVSLLHR